MVSAGNENLKSECNVCLKIMELISNETSKSKIGSVAYQKSNKQVIDIEKKIKPAETSSTNKTKHFLTKQKKIMESEIRNKNNTDKRKKAFIQLQNILKINVTPTGQNRKLLLLIKIILVQSSMVKTSNY